MISGSYFMKIFALSHVVQAHNGMTSARTEALRLQLVELHSQEEYLIAEVSPRLGWH